MQGREGKDREIMLSLTQAKKIADEIISLLSPYALKISIAGSIRREKLFVKDIEICCVPDTSKLYELQNVVNQWHKIKGGSKYQQYKLSSGIILDLFYATPENWGNIFLIRTGSAEFSKWIMGTKTREAGYVQRDGYLWQDNTKVPCPDEETYFRLLGMKWIEPKERER